MSAQLHTTLPQKGFVRLPQILSVIPVGRSTWWLWVKQKKAPAGLKIGPMITVWKCEDIHALIERLGQDTPERKAV